MHKQQIFMQASVVASKTENCSINFGLYMQTILNVCAVNRWTRSRRSRWTRRSEPKKTGFDSLRKSKDSCGRWESLLDLTICRKSTLLSYCRTPCFMHNLHTNSGCSCFMCVGKCKSQPQNAIRMTSGNQNGPNLLSEYMFLVLFWAD